VPGNGLKTTSSVRTSSEAYHGIFEHMLNGMAYCKVQYENGRPCDLLFLYVNPAFERQTGLKDVSGKQASEIVPGILESDFPLFEIFGRIALGSGPEKFETYVNALGVWFDISAYCPESEHVVIVFDVITERKLAEDKLRKSEERYLDVFDNTRDLIQCVSPDGCFLYTNRTWRETLGYSEQEIKNLNLADVLHPDSISCCRDRFSRLLMGERLQSIDFKFITKAGDTVYLSGDCGSIVKNGLVVSTRGIFKNISDRVEAEVALKASEDRYRAIYENAPDIFVTINYAGEIMSINRAGSIMLGYDTSELLGESISKIILPEDQQAIFSYIHKQFVDSSPDEGIECRSIRKDGSIFWVHQRATLDSDAKNSRLLIICRDITEKRGLEQQLIYQATHDALTNLVNRREFERRLQRILSDGQGSEDGHVLCFLDLDQFKIINDTCGHAAGDELLRQIAILLQGQMRSRDTLARLGGDEFAVLMEHCSLDRAALLAEKIRTMIKSFIFHWRSSQFSIAVSIGILPMPTGLSFEDALVQVDAACYAAKKSGGNSIHVFRPSDAPAFVDI
jgi:diguanylate cyclase (GGDEF)-like protein/PAS domain S-box-containing protein